MPVKDTIEAIKKGPKNARLYWLELHGDIEEFEPLDGDSVKALVTQYERMEQALVQIYDLRPTGELFNGPIHTTVTLIAQQALKDIEPAKETDDS